MKIKLNSPERHGPYLAVYTCGEPLSGADVFPEDIVLIKHTFTDNGDGSQTAQPWMIPLLGDKAPVKISNWEDYAILPVGHSLTLIQE
ncbi:hypothetical protein [Robiginitalea biformata]|uniref:Uncharacterized protein n=1 Tax=Robiginitalea biformata (strain ATCC BAA-864 / DSM 15991 / KCTC 12146 / HTCC2501) TaxID=313596 RepID=A4CKQ9_ROBBH|nr:hypothetical protein [Robiginitalea biformata]EAR15458.1 hypothetical protein RB2501_14059 [Robiginitalea biformata HTCC2501]